MTRSILITGGTGSFGHAFVSRALSENLYDRVAVLSRDEKKQQEMAAEFEHDERLRFYLGNVRNKDRLIRAFRDVHTVVHAAALKQVTRSGEAFDEFMTTNYFGSKNVVGACHEAGVKKCVFLGTDKSVSSSTPYGTSKQAAEWLFVAANAWGPCKFACTRYGNVLRSRGSVLETWQRQAEAGEPLTVTDPGMTRFWMEIGESVDLVLLALDRMNGGEIFVPYNLARGRIDELLRRFHPDAYVTTIGKRSYEKTHERLIAKEEVDRVRDCGDVYVVLPMHVRWEPRPYGEAYQAVAADFEYRSDK